MTGSAPDGPAGVLARILARRLREREAGTDGTLTVAELRRELLPYPRCRDAAGLASKAEYDLALLDLMADPGLLAVEDPELSDAVDRERGAAEPGLGFLDGYAASTLRPGPELVSLAAEAGTGPASSADAGAAGTVGDRAPERAGAPTADPAPPDGGRSRHADRSPGGERSSGEGRGLAADRPAGPDPRAPARAACWDCGDELPDREGLRYCPFCGADQRSPRCGACGEELEPGWSYCPGCGDEIGA